MLESLTRDCFYHLAGFLSVGDVAKIACVSAKCNDLVTNDVWKIYFTQYFKETRTKYGIVPESIHVKEKCFEICGSIHYDNNWDMYMDLGDVTGLDATKWGPDIKVIWEEYLERPCDCLAHYDQQTLHANLKMDTRQYKDYRNRYAFISKRDKPSMHLIDMKSQNAMREEKDLKRLIKDALYKLHGIQNTIIGASKDFLKRRRYEEYWDHVNRKKRKAGCSNNEA